MPTWSTYGGGEGQADALVAIIAHKSVSTGTITRGTTTVTAKTVRLETLASQQQRQGANGMTYSIDAFVLAAVGTDLRVGDRFTVGGQKFEVIEHLPGHTDCEQYYLTLRG
jgi:hypothetical protein